MTGHLTSMFPSIPYMIQMSPKASLLQSFRFLPRRDGIDWRRFSAIDVERIASELDISTLQANINSITFCNLDGERCPYCQQPADHVLLKVLKIAEFIIEYLLYCQESLCLNVSQLEEHVEEAVTEHQQTKDELAMQGEELKKKEESKRRKKLLATNEMLLQACANNLQACANNYPKRCQDLANKSTMTSNLGDLVDEGDRRERQKLQQELRILRNDKERQQIEWKKTINQMKKKHTVEKKELFNEDKRMKAAMSNNQRSANQQFEIQMQNLRSKIKYQKMLIKSQEKMTFDLLRGFSGEFHPLLLQDHLQLVAWTISGDHGMSLDFHLQLEGYYGIPGLPAIDAPTSPLGAYGLANPTVPYTAFVPLSLRLIPQSITAPWADILLSVDFCVVSDSQTSSSSILSVLGRVPCLVPPVLAGLDGYLLWPVLISLSVSNRSAEQWLLPFFLQTWKKKTDLVLGNTDAISRNPNVSRQFLTILEEVLVLKRCAKGIPSAKYKSRKSLLAIQLQQKMNKYPDIICIYMSFEAKNPRSTISMYPVKKPIQQSRNMVVVESRQPANRVPVPSPRRNVMGRKNESGTTNVASPLLPRTPLFTSEDDTSMIGRSPFPTTKHKYPRSRTKSRIQKKMEVYSDEDSLFDSDTSPKKLSPRSVMFSKGKTNQGSPLRLMTRSVERQLSKPRQKPGPRKPAKLHLSDFDSEISSLEEIIENLVIHLNFPPNIAPIRALTVRGTCAAAVHEDIMPTRADALTETLTPLTSQKLKIMEAESDRILLEMRATALQRGPGWLQGRFDGSGP
ncbi:LOW QUALITY PROTEIN: uncharacterized protein RCH25_043619 [Pelodytes ibericus]